MPIRARPQEARKAGAVARGELLESPGERQLVGGWWQVEAVGPNRRRDVGEEGVDRLDAKGGQHLLAVNVGMRAVSHAINVPRLTIV